MADRIVTVARFANSLEAGHVASLLEEAGIRTSLSNQNMATTYFTNAVGGVPLEVMEKDAERATEMIARFHEQAPTASGSAEMAGEPAPAAAPPPRAAALRPTPPDEEDKPLSPCDDAILHAYRAATMGLMFLPFIAHVYSAWCLIKAARLPGEHDHSLDRKLTAAILIDCVMLGLVVVVILTI